MTTFLATFILVCLALPLNISQAFALAHLVSRCTSVIRAPSSRISPASMNGSRKLDMSKGNNQQSPAVSSGQDDNHNDHDDIAVAAAMEYATLIGKLKTTPRTGWKMRGVFPYESVADHSWRVAALCYLLPRSRLDLNISKCVEMAIVHDMAECIVGDITPDDNVPKQEKQKQEMKAMQQITSFLSKQQQSSASTHTTTTDQYLMELFHEYEERSSKEAMAVKDLDKLDMILQAEEYEIKTGIDLQEFFDGTPVESFCTLEIQKVANEVHCRRKQRLGLANTKNNLPASSNMKVETASTGEADQSMSSQDHVFMEQFAKSSGLRAPDIANVVSALRKWEKDSSKVP